MSTGHLTKVRSVGDPRWTGPKTVQGNVPKSHEVKDDALVEETSSHPRYSVKKLMKLIHVTNTRQLSEIKPGQQSNTAGTWILKYFLESCRPFGPGDSLS